MSDDELFNHPVVRRLMEQLRAVETRLAHAEAKLTDHDSPLQRVLLVKRTDGSRLQWKEQSIVDGEVVEFTDGRGCDSDTDEAALIDPDQTEAVLEVVDATCHRYIPIGGASVTLGQYQYMVYQMVSQNVAGWDFVRGHPTL